MVIIPIFFDPPWSAFPLWGKGALEEDPMKHSNYRVKSDNIKGVFLFDQGYIKLTQGERLYDISQSLHPGLIGALPGGRVDFLTIRRKRSILMI